MKVSFIYAFGCILFITGIAVASENNKLSELSKLKAENLRLKAQLNSCMLATEENKLVETFRKELNATLEQIFDWSTLSFNTPSR